MIKITKIDKILELLTERELTSLEISTKLGIDKDILYPKLSRLDKENRTMRTNDKKPYKYIAITPKALLKQLYDIMDKKMKPISSLNEIEQKSLTKIEEMIE
ncbi:unnamed protein product [marine sediment metagenome]|uniref:Transcription regulator TrmB N-terminal domain-containing protein n=1 Tax=marine sediment metagenome TaxID=412755 RepID=X1I6S0_9ZZZZ